MENITIIKDINEVEHVIIDRGNGEFSSMPKEYYDKMIADAANRTNQPL